MYDGEGVMEGVMVEGETVEGVGDSSGVGI